MTEEGLTPGLDLGGGRQIPHEELRVKATRAGGAGGQHVNTSSTRIEPRGIPASRLTVEE
jgi:protein subunit release factor B